MIDHWVYESHDDGDDGDDDDDDEQKDSEHEDVDKTKDEEVCTMIHWKFLVAIPLPFRISHYPADSANLCPIVPGCWIQTQFEEEDDTFFFHVLGHVCMCGALIVNINILSP